LFPDGFFGHRSIIGILRNVSSNGTISISAGPFITRRVVAGSKAFSSGQNLIPERYEPQKLNALDNNPLWDQWSNVTALIIGVLFDEAHIFVMIRIKSLLTALTCSLTLFFL